MICLSLKKTNLRLMLHLNRGNILARFSVLIPSNANESKMITRAMFNLLAKNDLSYSYNSHSDPSRCGEKRETKTIRNSNWKVYRPCHRLFYFNLPNNYIYVRSEKV